MSPMYLRTYAHQHGSQSSKSLAIYWSESSARATTVHAPDQPRPFVNPVGDGGAAPSGPANTELPLFRNALEGIPPTAVSANCPLGALTNKPLRICPSASRYRSSAQRHPLQAAALTRACKTDRPQAVPALISQAGTWVANWSVRRFATQVAALPQLLGAHG